MGVNEISDDPEGLTALGTADMTQFLTDFRNLGAGRVPQPSAELAAVLAGATPIGSGRRSLRLARRSVLGVAAAVLVGGTSAAAATGRLPQPAQRLVSDVVGTITPFSIPSDHEMPLAPPHSVSPGPAHASTSRDRPSPTEREAPNAPGDRDDASPQRSAGDDGSREGSAAPSRSADETTRTPPAGDDGAAQPAEGDDAGPTQQGGWDDSGTTTAARASSPPDPTGSQDGAPTTPGDD